MDSITNCRSCGSTNISKDMDTESWVCGECGSGGGGADFWN